MHSTMLHEVLEGTYSCSAQELEQVAQQHKHTYVAHEAVRLVSCVEATMCW